MTEVLAWIMTLKPPPFLKSFLNGSFQPSFSNSTNVTPDSYRGSWLSHGTEALLSQAHNAINSAMRVVAASVPMTHTLTCLSLSQWLAERGMNRWHLDHIFCKVGCSKHSATGTTSYSLSHSLGATPQQFPQNFLTISVQFLFAFLTIS